MMNMIRPAHGSCELGERKITMTYPEQPKNREERPVQAPGPNTGGMGSVGQQTDEASLEAKLGVDRPGQRGEEEPHSHHSAGQGAPGFQAPTKEERERSRTGTPPQPEPRK